MRKSWRFRVVKLDAQEVANTDLSRVMDDILLLCMTSQGASNIEGERVKIIGSA